MIFQRFRTHEGAREMASPCAINGVIQAIDRYKPRRILEVGTGIGTLTSAILAAGPPTTEVVSAEDNDYCRDQLATLLGA
jgi:16S rRNA A1518/A1519 N6-dimethyltransferase RsmA/KsgA/DIM1 with predicted DNA glycosylase/AP lyase activity